MTPTPAGIDASIKLFEHQIEESNRTIAEAQLALDKLTGDLYEPIGMDLAEVALEGLIELETQRIGHMREGIAAARGQVGAHPLAAMTLNRKEAENLFEITCIARSLPLSFEDSAHLRDFCYLAAKLFESAYNTDNEEHHFGQWDGQRSCGYFEAIAAYAALMLWEAFGDGSDSGERMVQRLLEDAPAMPEFEVITEAKRLFEEVSKL